MDHSNETSELNNEATYGNQDAQNHLVILQDLHLFL